MACLPILYLSITCALFGAEPSTQSAKGPPNIIILLADDLGYGDLGCYGHPTIRTPNLDRMAREGARFTEFYSAAEVCTPSRAALLTGRYPIRSGMCHNQFRVLRNIATGGLPHSEITLAETLKKQGYSTACIGKWHLGVFSINPDHHPMRHGFDHFFGLPHSNDMDFSPGRPPGAQGRLEQDPAWWNSPLYRGTRVVERPVDQTTLTGRYTEESISFIRENKDKPFLLYLPHTFPHIPLFASKDFKGKSPRGLYGDVVEELDHSVGRILQTLRELGLDQNTLVAFSSDNGPWTTYNLAGGSAGLLRGGKGSTWEGGMRVPGILWGPGIVRANQTITEPASLMDLFTTCTLLGGGEVPKDREVDGLDLRSVLKGEGASPRGDMLFYRGQQLFAARVGDFKAHFLTQAGYGEPKPVAHDPPLLFNLKVDPSESTNVAQSHPEILSRIQGLVERHRAGVKPVENQLTGQVTVPKPTP